MLRKLLTRVFDAALMVARYQPYSMLVLVRLCVFHA